MLGSVLYYPGSVGSILCPTCNGTAARGLATDLKVWEPRRERMAAGEPLRYMTWGSDLWNGLPHDVLRAEEAGGAEMKAAVAKLLRAWGQNA